MNIEEKRTYIREYMRKARALGADNTIRKELLLLISIGYKYCTTCKNILPLCFFGKGRYLGKKHFECKKCSNLRTKKWVSNNKEKRQKISFLYSKKHRNELNEKTRLYRNRIRDKINEYGRKYNKEHKLEIRARSILNKAIKRGIITRLPCEQCGGNGHAHHNDYNKPLEVKWLCRSCHQLLHGRRCW